MKTQYFTLDKEDLENTADLVKELVMKALVKDGLLNFEDAENWSKVHTVLVAKKAFFRTLSGLWNKEKENGKVYLNIVKIM